MSLERRTPLKRGAGPRRRPRAARERISEETMLTVRRRQGGVCCCGCGRPISPGLIGAHHILPKARWPELVDEPLNVVGVFADCHASHETGMARLPREAVKLVLALPLDGPQRRYVENTYT